MCQLEIIGQDIPKSILLKANASGKIAHSYIFSGPVGIGKFTVARWFSVLLNCISPVESNPCWQCIPCKKIISYNHPDVKYIYPDRKTLNIKIDQVRSIQKESGYLPMESKWKIFIIDEANRLLDGAANCLLKTLEEPHPGMINILITSNLHSIISTIVSRCQIIRFSPISCNILIHFLVKKGIEEKKAHVLSQISQGSIGKALLLSKKENAWEIRNSVLDMLCSIQEFSVSDVLVKADKLPKDKEEVEFVLDIVLSWYRDVMFIKERAEFLINIDRQQTLKIQSENLSEWQIENCIGFARDALLNLSYQINSLFVYEKLFVSLNRVQNGVTI